ncbi:hypothetical protein ACE38W_15520 [Chitinophaga sp. Hz27]|uniref:hypothetical protein n=1 Tax=Chitinophaga sp. Hz27 TaxID=3347169 RepID=UPI0035D61420
MGDNSTCGQLIRIGVFLKIGCDVLKRSDMAENVDMHYIYCFNKFDWKASANYE